MARRGNKAIRATVSMKIAVSDSLLALVNNYVKALRFVLFWLKENVPNPEEKGVLSKVHEELYEKLREEYNLPSKVAEDCYREALATYKGWYNNPKKGRFPRVYKPTVWLTPRASYNVDFEAMIVRIASVGELPILGYLRCGRKMREVGYHRWFECSCGYENDRDVIAIVNLNRRGSLTLSSAHQMRAELMVGMMIPLEGIHRPSSVVGKSAIDPTSLMSHGKFPIIAVVSVCP